MGSPPAIARAALRLRAELAQVLPPTLLEACIRGNYGYWRSLDGGVNWTHYSAGNTPNGVEDYYPPVVDPYNQQHLLMAAHEANRLVESFDQGQTWTAKTLSPLMTDTGTAFPFFIDTGNATTTAQTWLYITQDSKGTWRTSNSGATWQKVENNTHPHGNSQIYQPDSSGVVYMAGVQSALGWGVLRSADYGQTWTHVGAASGMAIVYGTPNNIYSEWGWACENCLLDPAFQHAAPPGLTGWSTPCRCGITDGAGGAAVTWDGSSYVIVTANWNAGLWRYVESPGGVTPTPTATHNPLTPTNTPPATATPTNTPGPSPTPTSTATAYPIGTPISTSGLHVGTGGQANLILNSSNQPVRLRGVNYAGLEYMCTVGQMFDYPPLNSAMPDQGFIDTLKTWQINVVRLPINEACWLGINGMPAAPLSASTYRSQIVTFIANLNANNIAVVFDLQWAAPGTIAPDFHLEQMPNADHSVDFWLSAATTSGIGNNNMVIFDLFNEPWPLDNADNVSAWTCLRDGRAACGAVPESQLGGTFTAVGMQELVTTIRTAGATNIIQSPGVQFTNSLSSWLAYKPTDPSNNLIADWHSYQNQICNNQTCWDTNIKPVAQAVPLVTNEIGNQDCSHENFLDPLMDFLDHESAGYLGWQWNPYDCAGAPSLITDYSGNPTQYGVGLYSHLLFAAGLATPTPVPIPFFNNGNFPVGLWVGGTSPYTASDDTVYYPDQTASDGSLLVFTNFTQGYNMQPYETNASIEGPDRTLYQTGRQGCCAKWLIRVPNGSYKVTLGAAPNLAFTSLTPTPGAYTLGEFGQDHTLGNTRVAYCVWSRYPYPLQSPFTAASCPGATPLPETLAPNLVSYDVVVTNQTIGILVGASFGDSRQTILNTIKIACALCPPSSATSTPTAVASATPSGSYGQDSFENGIRTPPWVISQNAGGSFSIASTAHSGSSAVQLTRASTVPDRSSVYLTNSFSMSGSKAYARTYARFNSITADTTARASRNFCVGNPAVANELVACFGAHSTNQLEASLRRRDGTWYTHDVLTLPLSSYLGLEIDVDLSGASPIVTWLDSSGTGTWTQIDQITDTTSGTTVPPSLSRIGAWTDSADPPLSGTVQAVMDDYVLSAQPLGP